MNQITQVNKLDVAMTDIICNHPFFSSLLLQYPIEEDRTIPTACVNAFGRIRYNPDWLLEFEVDEIVFVLCHECMHYMYMHVVRCFGRDPQQFNVACDAVINETLKVSGIGRMPAQGVELPGAEHKTAEEVYAGMPKQPPGQGQGQGQGQTSNSGGPVDPSKQPTGDPGTIGNDLDPTGTEDLSREEENALEEEVKTRILQAAQVAKQVGNMPAALEGFVHNLVNVTTPWYELMRPYFSSLALNDHSYDSVDRRFVHSGIYMPAEWGKGAGTIVWVNDESGSISQQEFDNAAAHVNNILEDIRPDKFVVLHCAARVHPEHDVYEPDDYPVDFQSKLSGGTDMTVGIREAVEHYPEAECIVVFTDGYTPYGDAEIAQDIPVLWCITTGNKAPWGETIKVDLD